MSDPRPDQIRIRPRSPNPNYNFSTDDISRSCFTGRAARPANGSIDNGKRRRLAMLFSPPAAAGGVKEVVLLRTPARDQNLPSG